MSYRLEQGGLRIDRSRRIGFSFDGRGTEGFAGDTLASALLGTGRRVMGRSFKYHRPRGPVTCGADEPNALVNLGQGGRAEPNQRATVTELFEGLTATSQNRWPSLAFDVGAINARLSRFLPAGFYYKTFLWPRSFWKHVYEPVIRASAGLGRPPEGPDADRYEHLNVHADLLVAGGGVAGLQAALMAGRAGVSVLLVEETAHWGGRAVIDAATDGARIDGQPVADWVAAAVAELGSMANVTMRLRTVAAGLYDHGFALAWERVTDHRPWDDAPRHRLWRIRARHVVTATGALERPIAFPGNDLPGVMLAGAVREYLTGYGVAVGREVVVVTNNDDAYRTAHALKAAGVRVPAILDVRSGVASGAPAAAREAGFRVLERSAIAKVTGGSSVEAVTLTSGETIICDAVAMSGGYSPVVHLWSHTGGKLLWDETQAHFRPDPDRAPLAADGGAAATAAGAATGGLTLAETLASGGQAAQAALTRLGHAEADAATIATAEPEDVLPMKPVWMMPAEATAAQRQKMWLDYQNDVKVSDVQLAQREGYESVEHAKRYTTLGMATDQGKLSNINGLAILAQAKGEAIPQVGTTTFRPPYVPISMGSIAGEARGGLFQPIRRTPMHALHDEAGAVWEPVGHWRRPFAYPQKGETRDEAVQREIAQVRGRVAMLDASTLGKIVVKGPDAGRFLDMIYTNMMSTLKVGRCRYGLICSENGFLIDDGVVARLGEDEFLCHTTTGGADRIHGHMEEWLQTEWWDWQVYTANVTEQWAQVAVAGPKAREVLESLGGLDLARDTLPFMSWTEGRLGDIPARVFRISFSGELSYEIAVPASRGPELWRALRRAGKPHGIVPYGTEAMHILRAEKGFVMIGDETDGTVIPQDLGLDWAISKKKDDYIGKRAQMRPHMADPERWKLVGLETLDGSVLSHAALALEDGQNALGQRRTQGRVTSTYRSPTLNRGIAMGLVRHGPDRMGEVLEFSRVTGGTVQVRIVDPVLYDKEGKRQDV
ncbi:sarcosine oxidase subunit alpha family protein [Mesobaculum littorinae]|uniref:Sarcosine oxidase subunit alpha family protein n=1 Tax=Mesobaculum littorinae TaxID=2486419 RepID=A0A438AJD9_9RHOB|nr:sarcosine oxidase subunit alpha family protein [Mesobaculum littorinae]RVV98764.1 sarcosine oxidase subunit alpha family protein [Mesobaculum littorinae]